MHNNIFSFQIYKSWWAQPKCRNFFLQENAARITLEKDFPRKSWKIFSPRKWEKKITTAALVISFLTMSRFLALFAAKMQSRQEKSEEKKIFGKNLNSGFQSAKNEKKSFGKTAKTAK